MEFVKQERGRRSEGRHVFRLKGYEKQWVDPEDEKMVWIASD